MRKLVRFKLTIGILAIILFTYGIFTDASVIFHIGWGLGVCLGIFSLLMAEYEANYVTTDTEHKTRME